LDATLEGEAGDVGNVFASGDKTTLKLPGNQQKLLEKVTEAAADKPVILVMLSGSAMDMEWAHENAGAVVQAFYPGAQGGLAVAELLFGRYSPEGKLPLTFYKSDKDLPDFRNYDMDNRTYRYFTSEPLYPFGYGLGYHKFSLSDASFADGKVTVSVRNGGGYGAIETAAETVQVYAKAEGAKERWNLCGIAKAALKGGESKKITVDISPAAFSRYDDNGDLQPCKGKKTLYVGFGQPDARTEALTGVKALEISL
jgi:beta-glucosidase